MAYWRKLKSSTLRVRPGSGIRFGCGNPSLSDLFFMQSHELAGLIVFYYIKLIRRTSDWLATAAVVGRQITVIVIMLASYPVWWARVINMSASSSRPVAHFSATCGRISPKKSNITLLKRGT